MLSTEKMNNIQTFRTFTTLNALPDGQESDESGGDDTASPQPSGDDN